MTCGQTASADVGTASMMMITSTTSVTAGIMSAFVRFKDAWANNDLDLQNLWVDAQGINKEIDK